MIGSPYNSVGGLFVLLLLPLFFCSRYALLDDDCSPVISCDEVPPYPPEGEDQRNECVVGTTSDARNLAEAVRCCSGGAFEVEWRGSVIVHETISVVNGTVLKVFGSGPDAVIDGGGSTRMFTLDNASLDLSNVTIINGMSTTSGGAIVASSSNLAFRNTSFYGNNASWNGGALILSKGSSATFDETTRFQENTAGADGGALYLSDGSTAVWMGETSFWYNSAANGGAVCVLRGSNISWTGGTDFVGNTAINSSGVGIGGGGAIFVGDGAKVEWNGTMNFTSNFASWDGGAVAAESASGMTKPQSCIISPVPRILVGGPTIFFNNTCGGNGGGMSLRATSSMSFKTLQVRFSNNSAALAGGAVFMSETIDGPMFLNVEFNGNFAQVGGGVYTSLMWSTVTMDGCRFVGNVASYSGGAMENVGHMKIVDTSFVANEAEIGGALRLTGTTSLDDCTFVENVSKEDGGAAMSNIGIISTLNGAVFKDNLFSCDPGSFLDFHQDTNRSLHGICNGCSSCDGCFFDGRSAAPTCTSVLEAGIDRASSPGGTTTIEGLIIGRGYWRATNTSRDVFKCDNTEACSGGLTGSPDYCSEGFYGPLCGICMEGFRRQEDLTCRECSSLGANLVVAICVLSVVCVTFGVPLAFYMVSGNMEWSGQGVVDHMGRHVPFQSIRIIIVTWQILSQFTSSLKFSYTFIYQTFLSFVAVINFDIGWAISLGCIFELDFGERMILTTLAPTAVLAMLAVTYVVAATRHRESETALRNIRHKHLSMVLLVMFLVYASVSSALLPMFVCNDTIDGKSYLRVDYRIECLSQRHRALQTYAGVMILLYPIGIPSLYSWLLFRNGDLLVKEARREDDAKIQPTSDLWKSYKPSRYYYEIVECIRRLVITSVVVMILPGTVAQLSVVIMVVFGFGIMVEVLAPYKSPWDTWISRAGYIIDFSSIFYASQLEVDMMAEQGRSSHIFDAILVAANVCMAVAVLVQGIISVRSSRVYELKDPVAGLCRTGDRGEAKVV